MRRLVVAVCVAAACSSASVDPLQLAQQPPQPAAALDDATHRRATELGARALDGANAGQAESARGDAEAALALDPRQPRARSAIGVLSMLEAQIDDPPRLSVWRRAEGELLLAASLAEGDVEVALALARFYVADGHGQAALEVLESALAHAPEHVAALRLAGLVAYEASEERRARDYLARLLALQPQDTATLYRLAQCDAVIADTMRDDSAKQQAWQQVAGQFAHYRQLMPNDAQGAVGEGHARFRLWELGAKKDGDPELRSALELYRVAGQADPNAPEGPFGEAVVLEMMRDESGAEAAYRMALRRRAAHAPSLLNLAALLAKRGAVDEARALWEKALRAGLTPLERRKVASLLGAR